MKARPFVAQLGKDCRRLALPAALWLSSFAVYVALSLWYSTGANDHDHQGWLLWLVCAELIFHLMTLILAGWVVLEDTPVGTTGFWLTRPLPRWKMVAEKLVLLGAIVLVPIVLEGGCIVLANFNSPPSGIQLAAWGGGGLLVAIPEVLVVALFAVLAESFGQLVITAVLTILAAGLAALMLMRTGLLPHVSDGFMYSSRSLMTSRTWADEALGVTLAGILVVWSYVRPHARGLRVAAGLICVAVMVLPSSWTRDFVKAWSGVYPGVDTKAWPQLDKAPHFSANQPVVNTMLVNANGLKGRIEPVSGPAGTVIFPHKLYDLKVDWRAGGSASLSGMEVELAVGALGYPPAAAAALAPLRVIGAVSRDGTGTFAIQPMGDVATVWDRLQPAEFHAKVENSLRHSQVSTELALRIGARVSWNMQTWKVAARDAEPGKIRVDLTDGLLSSAFDVLNPSDEHPSTIYTSNVGQNTNISDLVTAPAESEVFALTNRDRGEAILSARCLVTGERKIADYDIIRYRVEFEDPALNEAWLQGATLVRLRMAEITGVADGTFDAPIREVR